MPKLRAIPVKPQAWWRIHIDVLGPLDMSNNGNQYVAIAVDALTKYVEAARNMIMLSKITETPPGGVEG